MVRDENPAYWDDEFAARVWGGLVAPPALLMGLLIPPPWLPPGQPRAASIALRVPLPGNTFINASNEAEFPAPIREGDRLSVVEEVVSVSPEKTTKLGAGHFVETCETIPPRRRRGGGHEPKHVVPLHSCAAMRWDEIVVPADLPEVVDDISYQRVVMNAGATWDYFPGHYDPEYARTHGHPTIFVNTMHIAGFVDRVATGWAGPYSRVVRRKMRMLGPIYAEDSMVGRGRVTAKRRDRRPDSWWTSRSRSSTSAAKCAVPAEVTVEFLAPR